MIARSEMLDFTRKKKSLVEAEKNWIEMSQSSPVASLDMVNEWQSLLECLGPEGRQVMVERAVHEQDFEDIATRLGKEAAAVRQIFSRSRKRLRDKLSGKEEETS